MIINLFIFGAAPDSLLNDLQVWYKFDESSGTTISDSSGNGRNATVTNATGFVWHPTGGAIDGAAEFDGTNTEASYGGSIPIGTNDFTISFYVYRDIDTTTMRLFAMNQNIDNYWVLEIGSAESIKFEAWKSTVNEIKIESAFAQDLPATTWRKIVIQCDRDNATNTKIFVGNIEVSGAYQNKVISTANIDNTGGFRVGYWTSSSKFDGRLDQLRVHSRLLTQAEREGI